MSRTPLLMAVTLGFMLMHSSASAGLTLVPSEAVGQKDVPRVEVISADSQGTVLEFQLPVLSVEELTAEGVKYQNVAIPNGGLSGQVGEPGIPEFTQLVMIPDDVGVTVSATPEEQQELPGFTLMPVQRDDAEVFARDEAAYQRKGYETVPPAKVGDPAILRDLRVVAVTLHPVQYDPSRRSLQVSSRMRIEVRYEGLNPVNAKATHRAGMATSFDQLYRSLVVNYPGDLKAQAQAHGTWLLICPNDATVISKLQPLLAWRQRKGLPVRLATTAETGTTNTAIKAYIQNAYNTWNTPPEYIVLAGDAAGSYIIPTFNESLSFQNGEGDHFYTLLAGSDDYSDVHIGRLSFSSTTELDVIVAKIVGYESTPYMTDTSWFTRACLVGDPTESGYSCVQTQQWIKSRLSTMGYAQIDTVFSGNFVAGMQTALNRGDAFFCYRGFYGFSGWSNGYTNALTNGWKLSFAVISTCGTGSFANSTSNSEAFLRAGTIAGSVVTPKGSVGCIGTATTGTHTRFNNCYTLGTFQGMLYEGLYEQGVAHARGKLELHREYDGTAQSNYAIIFSYWNNLMGDPATEIWTAVPRALVVTHPAALSIGANSVSVSVGDNGLPAAGACVCLWKGTETFITGLTGSNGSVELPVSAATAGNLLITVTKHNCQPYKSQITVSAPTLFVGYQSSTIDDDNNGTSQGNADGQINPGEGIQLPVQLKNTGGAAATAVTATLTTSDPYVTITENSQSFGDIAGGTSVWSAGDFDLTVDYACPQNHIIRLGLNVTSGTDTWQSLILLTVTAPDLAATASTLYGAGPNGILDPGETVGLSVALKNNGGQSAATPTAVLKSLDPSITVSDSLGTYETIAVGSTVENTADQFTVGAGVSTFKGHLATLRLITACDGGAADTTFVSLTVGQRSTTDPVGPDHYGYCAFDNTDTSYPEVPTYNWVELDPSHGGTGTEVVLGDGGDSQDRTVGVTLPFTFNYYGQAYTRASICSNGWLALGETRLTDFRNWTIPGAGAPNNLLAVYWDDLYQGSGSKAYQKYDSANHRWIIEWSRFLNVNGGQTVTIEAILYDSLFYTTSTGDGAIVFQYNSVGTADSEDGYFTVGIQNHDHTDGVLYSYFNLYAGGGATIQAGRAIRFLPVISQPTGFLQGIATNASYANVPLPNATVTLLQGGRTLTTGSDGGYGGNVVEGTYTAVATRAGFQPDTIHNVVLASSHTTTTDFLMTDNAGPDIADVPQLSMTINTTGPYTVNAVITDMSSVANAQLYYRAGLGAWTNTPMSRLTGDVYQGNIPGQVAGIQIDYYVWAQDGAGLASMFPPGASTAFYTFYTTQLFYSTNCEDPGDSNWQMGVTGDNAATGTWVRENPVGTVYNGQQMQPESDHTADPSTKCFVTGNGAVGGAPGDADVDDGCTTLRSPVFDLTLASQAFVDYWRWFALSGNSQGDQLAVDVSSDGGSTWVSLEQIAVTENSWTEACFDLKQFITLTDQVVFRFVACDLGAQGLVEAAVDDFILGALMSGAAGTPDAAALTPVFQLSPSRPNPFVESTEIEFSLAAAGPARLALYDVEGRLVRILAQGRQPAGRHAARWNGTDESDLPLPSGIYFYRLDAGSHHEVRKLIHLE